MSTRMKAPRWLPLPLGLGIGLLGGLGYGIAATPQYAATSYVMVVPDHADSPTALGFAQAYGRVVTGSAVLAGAQAAAGAPADRLRGHVQAQTSPDAPMISVTGTASSGAAAARYANAVARSLTATGNRTAPSTGVRLLVLSPASAPASPPPRPRPCPRRWARARAACWARWCSWCAPRPAARTRTRSAAVPSPSHALATRETV